MAAAASSSTEEEEVTVFRRMAPPLTPCVPAAPDGSPIRSAMSQFLDAGRRPQPPPPPAAAADGGGAVAAAAATATAYSHFCYGNLHRNGKLAVPVQDTRELAEAYVRDFKAGWYSALTENRPGGPSEASRFYLDFDLDTDAEPSETMFRRFEEVLQRVVTRFFPGQPRDARTFMATVCSSGVRNVACSKGGDRYRAGIHIYYPHLYLLLEQALHVSTAILVSAQCELAEFGTPEEWAKRIDQNVYAEGRGLRWVWQLKDRKCDGCDGGGPRKRNRHDAAAAAVATAAGTERCLQCGGVGRVPDLAASMYSPIYRLSGCGLRVAIKPDPRLAPTADLMMECSLRAYVMPLPTSGFALYAGAPPIPKFKFGGAAAETAEATGGTLYESGAADMSRAVRNAADEYDGGSYQARAVYTMLQRLDAQWAKCIITKVTQHVLASGKVYYKIFISGEGSGRCKNFGGDHRHARVYFIADKDGLKQRCFCKCPQARAPSGLACKAWTSPAFPYLSSDPKLVFQAGELVRGSSSSGDPLAAAAGAAAGATEAAEASGAGLSAKLEATMYFGGLLGSKATPLKVVSTRPRK